MRPLLGGPLTTAEAAQKWAEAKDAAKAAYDAYKGAEVTYATAFKAENEAWEALETLAGRSVEPAPRVASVTFTEAKRDEWRNSGPAVRIG